MLMMLMMMMMMMMMTMIRHSDDEDFSVSLLHVDGRRHSCCAGKDIGGGDSLPESH